MTLVRAASSIAKAQKSTPTASKTTAPSTNTTAPVNNATVGLSAAQVAGLKGMKGIDQNLLSNYKAGTGGTAITASKLVPNAPVNIPTKDPVTGVPDIGAVNQGLTDTAGGITTDATGKFVVTPTTAPTSTDKYSGLTNLFNQYQAQSNAIKPPSGEAIYNAQYKADGIAQKQQAVNDYTAQLNTIVANRDANVLKVEGQGRGIPDVIIGGQQAQINKEAAIAALPIQAQLAAAQGNLELAQSHLDTMFKIKSQDATNQYNYKTKLLDSVYNFASGIEKSKLDDLKVEEDRKYQEQQTFIKAQQAALSNALGQGAPASVYNAIKNATDLNGVTIAAGIYNGDVLGREAQRANIAQSWASVRASNATTTAANAARSGTLNGKAQTDAERKVQTYAERMASADTTLNKIGNQFTSNTSWGGLLPSVLQSADRQVFEQAKLNFVNAKLRQESGAVIGDSEFKKADLQYFPQPGDTAEALAAKAANRAMVINGGYREANVPTPSPVQTEVSTTPLKVGDSGTLGSGVTWKVLP